MSVLVQLKGKVIGKTIDVPLDNEGRQKKDKDGNIIKKHKLFVLQPHDFRNNVPIGIEEGLYKATKEMSDIDLMVEVNAYRIVGTNGQVSSGIYYQVPKNHSPF